MNSLLFDLPDIEVEEIVTTIGFGSDAFEVFEQIRRQVSPISHGHLGEVRNDM